jgi:hypothetical protein
VQARRAAGPIAGGDSLAFCFTGSRLIAEFDAPIAVMMDMELA